MLKSNEPKYPVKFDYFGTIWRIAAILFVGFSLYLFISMVITVFLTKASRDVTVPDVTGVSFIEVYNTIARKDIVPEVKFKDVYDTDDGIILSQHPDPGEVVPVNSKLTLVVSRNTILLDVPKVTGMALPIALNKLKSLNYHGGSISLSTGVISYIPSAKHAENTVIAQSPSAGEKVGPDRKVNLLVSSGNAAADQNMPDVVNQSIELCYGILLSKGFSVSQEIVVATDKGLSGRVAWQKPEPGAAVPRGGSVQLGVYLYPMEEHPYRAYEKVEYQVPSDAKKSLYEAFVEDFNAKTTAFSRVMGPGEKIVFVFRREGNARITITANKEPQRVIGMDYDD